MSGGAGRVVEVVQPTPVGAHPEATGTIVGHGVDPLVADALGADRDTNEAVLIAVVAGQAA